MCSCHINHSKYMVWYIKAPYSFIQSWYVFLLKRYLISWFSVVVIWTIDAGSVHFLFVFF